MTYASRSPRTGPGGGPGRSGPPRRTVPVRSTTRTGSRVAASFTQSRPAASSSTTRARTRAVPATRSRRSAGQSASIGTYAVPASTVPSEAVTTAAERPARTPTPSSGRRFQPVRARARPVARAASSAYERTVAPSTTAGAPGVARTRAANASGRLVSVVPGGSAAPRPWSRSVRAASSPSSGRSRTGVSESAPANAVRKPITACWWRWTSSGWWSAGSVSKPICGPVPSGRSETNRETSSTGPRDSRREAAGLPAKSRS